MDRRFAGMHGARERSTLPPLSLHELGGQLAVVPVRKIAVSNGETAVAAEKRSPFYAKRSAFFCETAHLPPSIRSLSAHDTPCANHFMHVEGLWSQSGRVNPRSRLCTPVLWNVEG